MIPTTATIEPPAATDASKSWLDLTNATTIASTMATVTIPPTVSVDRLNGVEGVNGSISWGAGFGNDISSGEKAPTPEERGCR